MVPVPSASNPQVYCSPTAALETMYLIHAAPVPLYVKCSQLCPFNVVLTTAAPVPAADQPVVPPTPLGLVTRFAGDAAAAVPPRSAKVHPATRIRDTVAFQRTSHRPPVRKNVSVPEPVRVKPSARMHSILPSRSELFYGVQACLRPIAGGGNLSARGTRARPRSGGSEPGDGASPVPGGSGISPSAPRGHAAVPGVNGSEPVSVTEPGVKVVPRLIRPWWRGGFFMHLDGRRAACRMRRSTPRP